MSHCKRKKQIHLEPGKQNQSPNFDNLQLIKVYNVYVDRVLIEFRLVTIIF